MSDIDYYRARAATQRAAAELAENENVREIHEELVRLYEALADNADLRPLRMVPEIRHEQINRASAGQGVQQL